MVKDKQSAGTICPSQKIKSMESFSSSEEDESSSEAGVKSILSTLFSEAA